MIMWLIDDIFYPKHSYMAKKKTVIFITVYQGMCIFCRSQEHMCCWRSARVCESEIMWERELQRWVRKWVRQWASRQGVDQKPPLKAVQQAAARGAAGEEKRWKGLGKGLGWEDVKQSEQERERVRRRRRRRRMRGAHKWNSPRGSMWVSAEIKAKRSTGNTVQSASCDWHTGHWEIPGIFLPLWMIQQYFLIFCGAWRANEISQPVSSKLSVSVGWKSDVKRCNKSLKVVCGS